MSDTYALELKLAGRKCVVVGGGSVAARKVQTLARTGAEVHVVAPQIDASIRSIPHVQCYEEPFAAEILRGATLVFACTDQPGVNREVAEAATAVGAWVNVADDPGRCDFFVPASLERGEFRVTVSTGGASPQLAGSIRRQLESLFGPEYGTLVGELRRARTTVLEQIADPRARREVFETLCADESIERLKTQGVTTWREWVEQIVHTHL